MLMCADEWHHSLVCWRPHISARCLIITTMIVCVCVFNSESNLCNFICSQQSELPFCVLLFLFPIAPLAHHTRTQPTIISPPGANLLSAWLLLLLLRLQLPGKNVTWRRRVTSLFYYRCTGECLWRLLRRRLLLVCVCSVWLSARWMSLINHYYSTVGVCIFCHYWLTRRSLLSLLVLPANAIRSRTCDWWWCTVSITPPPQLI